MSSIKFENLVDMFERSVKANGPRELFGTKKSGQWIWTTYAELGKLVDDFRGGLAARFLRRRIRFEFDAFILLLLGFELRLAHHLQLLRDKGIVDRLLDRGIFVRHPAEHAHRGD